MIQKKKKALLSALAMTTVLLSSCLDWDDLDGPEQGSNGFVLGAIGGNYGYDVEETDRVYPFRSKSPYRNVLKRCVLVTEPEESCRVSELPFIGNGVIQPSLDDIMNRVLVTHDWMGVRFEEMMLSAPPEVYTMFASATAVLIGSKVRPSYYTTVSGAIQIDPVYLWSSVDEKGSISKQEDFRAGFGNELQFWFLQRTADKFGNRLTPYYSLDDDSERPLADIKLPLMRLLIHELAHATDFMPRSQIAGLSTSLTIYDAITSVRDSWLSPLLYTTHPLSSLEMQSLAGVRFGGQEATIAQKAMTAGDVGLLMGSDGAAQFYSYTTIREDIAQLVETIVMSVRYDAQSNVGFVQKPADTENYSCNDLLVSWGQRNRTVDPLVAARAFKAVELVLGNTAELMSYMNNDVTYSELMRNNINWCENQQATLLADGGEEAQESSKQAAPVSGSLFREMIRENSFVHPVPTH